MQNRIGVLAIMLDPDKICKKSSRPLNVLQNTDEYKVIFGDTITYENNQICLQSHPIDILFDRYPYQTYAKQDPLKKRHFLEIQDMCVPICNPRIFTELCKDKWAFQKYMLKNDVYMPPIAQDHFQYWIEKWGGVAIAKPQFGSFGVGIELIEFSPSPFRESVHGLDPTIIQKYIQPPIGFAGISVRQLIQRNADRSWTLRTAVARISLNDPIVNAARGADIARAIDMLPTKCCKKIHSMSNKIAHALGKISPFVIEVGLDYVISQHFEPVFIEANAQPKGKLKGLLQSQRIPSIVSEHQNILRYPFEVMSKWTMRK